MRVMPLWRGMYHCVDNDNWRMMTHHSTAVVYTKNNIMHATVYFTYNGGVLIAGLICLWQLLYLLLLG